MVDDYVDPDRLFDFDSDPPGVPTPEPGVQVIEVRPPEPPEEQAAEDALAVAQSVGVDLDQPVQVNYLSEVADLLADTARIREFAMRTNRRTGEREVANPILFEKAVARRQSILSSAVKLHRELMDQHAQSEFYRLVVRTIALESPPTAHRLIAALRAVNNPLLQVVGGEA